MGSMCQHKPTGMYFCRLLFIGLLFFSSVALAEAHQMPATGHELITWETLLPESARGKALAENSITSTGQLQAVLAARERASPNAAMQGRMIRIHGFIVPLEYNERGALTEFLLVPYFGACIHVPPPPQNQIIFVTLEEPALGLQSMDTVTVYGKLELEPSQSASGEAAYRIRAAGLERDAALASSNIWLAIGLTLLCGMSVCLGWVGPFASIRLDPRISVLSAAFAAGLLVCLGLSTVILNVSVKTSGAFLTGALLMLLFERFLHGMTNLSGNPGNRYSAMGSSVAIALHNLPECFIVFSSVITNPSLGLALGCAMIAHNVPMGLSLGLSSNGTLHRHQAWTYATLAGVLPPVVTILAYFFLRSVFSPDIIKLLFAGAGGAMVFIGLTELMPFAWRCGKSTTVLPGFVAGVALLLLLLRFSSQEW